MRKLINKYKEIKKSKKGFTLVELLVVIAILAVLASVSVVGYLGFTEKARNSNAVTELTQVRELMRAELIDGEDHEFKYAPTSGIETTFKMKYVDGDYYFLDLESVPTSPADKTADFKGGFSDLSGLNATITVYFGTAATKSVGGDTTANDYPIKYVNYERTAGGSAHWTVSSDSIDTGLHTA